MVELKTKVGLRVDRATVAIGRITLVHEAGFVAHAGQVTCVVGPNGAGKSSLLKAIAGILPYSGSVYIAGENADAWEPRQRALHIGYVPQRTALQLPFSAREVVTQGLYAEAGDTWGTPPMLRERALAALHGLGMADFAERIFTTLSGGEQQLVLLARALIVKPPLLLLDEPSSALDIRHRLDLDIRLRTLAASGLTVLVILHDLAEVLEIADRVVLMDYGRLVADGSPTEILAGDHCATVFGVRMLRDAGPRFVRDAPSSPADSSYGQ